MRIWTVKPVGAKKVIPKLGLAPFRRPSTSRLFQRGVIHSIGSSQIMRAIPAGQWARNFRPRVFREDNASDRLRSLDRQSTSPPFSAARDRSRQSFSESPVVQIAKT